MRQARRGWPALALLMLLLGGCAPLPEVNVLGYLLARQLGTAPTAPAPNMPRGTLSGTLTHAGQPIEGATLVVAAPDGTPFAATSDTQGRVTIRGVPAGQYVPAAVAPGFDETSPSGLLGIPQLVTVAADTVTELPPMQLTAHQPRPLPDSVSLTQTGTYTASAPYPPDAVAQVTSYTYQVNGVEVDSLRVYLPRSAAAVRARGEQLPLLFMIYPTDVTAWEPVSVGFAAAGYGFVAVSPMAARGTDIDAHAYDARVAFALLRQGALDPVLAADEAIMLGGSFSSPIMHRFLRDESAHVAGWVTVGGISNAFTLAAAYYAGAISLPPDYTYAIPALGPPHVYPLLYLRYSPVYTAGQLPPTLIVHTPADEITPIEQAYELEAALHAAGVPVETMYYEDVSHNIQIGENMSPVGPAIFERVYAFAAAHQSRPPQP